MKTENERRLRAALQEYAGRDIPANLDLRPAVLPQTQRPRMSWRPALLATGLLVVLLLVGFGSALWLRLPGGGVAAKPLAEQTIDGYTVAITAASIDANQTIITYTLSSAENSIVGMVPGIWNGTRNVGPQLRNADGSSLNFIGTVFPRIYNTDASLQDTPLDEGRLVFATDSLGAESSRELKLEFALAHTLQQMNLPASKAPQSALVGPFSFDIDVPVDHMVRTAELLPLVVANKIALRLLDVTVTRSEARIHLALADGGVVNGVVGVAAAADATLQIGTWTSASNDGAARIVGTTQGWTYAYLDYPLIDKEGEWTLTINSLPASLEATVTGPWTFKFSLPEAK